MKFLQNGLLRIWLELSLNVFFMQCVGGSITVFPLNYFFKNDSIVNNCSRLGICYLHLEQRADFQKGLEDNYNVFLGTQDVHVQCPSEMLQILLSRNTKCTVSICYLIVFVWPGDVRAEVTGNKKWRNPDCFCHCE